MSVYDKRKNERATEMERQTFWGLEDESGVSGCTKVILCLDLDLVLGQWFQTVEQSLGQWTMRVIVDNNVSSPMFQSLALLWTHLTTHITRHSRHQGRPPPKSPIYKESKKRISEKIYNF